MRIAYLDSLRVALTALVMCHHLVIAFGGPGSWYYIVASPSDMLSQVLMAMFTAVNQAFFMSLFFFVSAYFTAPSLDKKDTKRFLRDRLMRLGLPLLGFYFLLNPLLDYMVMRLAGRLDSGFIGFVRDDWLASTGFGPLWFVWSLLLFSLAYLALAGWKIKRQDAGSKMPLPGNLGILAFVLVIGALTFLLRLVFPTGYWVAGMQVGYYPLYVCMFAFGIMTYRHGWLEQLHDAQANRWFRIALASIVLLPPLMFFGVSETRGLDIFFGGLSWQAYTYAAWEPFICVGISMKLIVLFRKRLNTSGGLQQRLAKSAYTAYIVHPFFVIGGTALLATWAAPPLLRALIAAPAILAACFLASNLIRQAPLLRRVL